MRLHRALQEAGLHQERQPQLGGRRQDPHVPAQPSAPRQRQVGELGGQGEQRLHQAQAGDHRAQRREASQGRAGFAQQEDSALLRAGLDRHHRRYQAGLGGRQKALHRRWQDGRCYLQTKGFKTWCSGTRLN